MENFYVEMMINIASVLIKEISKGINVSIEDVRDESFRNFVGGYGGFPNGFIV